MPCIVMQDRKNTCKQICGEYLQKALCMWPDRFPENAGDGIYVNYMPIGQNSLQNIFLSKRPDFRNQHQEKAANSELMFLGVYMPFMVDESSVIYMFTTHSGKFVETLMHVACSENGMSL